MMFEIELTSLFFHLCCFILPQTRFSKFVDYLIARFPQANRPPQSIFFLKYGVLLGVCLLLTCFFMTVLLLIPPLDLESSIYTRSLPKVLL